MGLLCYGPLGIFVLLLFCVHYAEAVSKYQDADNSDVCFSAKSCRCR